MHLTVLFEVIFRVCLIIFLLKEFPLEVVLEEPCIKSLFDSDFRKCFSKKHYECFSTILKLFSNLLPNVQFFFKNTFQARSTF